MTTDGTGVKELVMKIRKGKTGERDEEKIFRG